MFSNTYQQGLLTAFFAGGSRPLAIWKTTVREGHVKRVSDEDANNCLALEIVASNVATTYITSPPDSSPTASLGIRLPWIYIIFKNLNRYFSFEIQILDETNTRRRFRMSNYQSTTRIRPFTCTMPLALNKNWNQVQFNLEEFVRKAYNTGYVETQRLQVHANCRLRRIFFSSRVYTASELPIEYKLIIPKSKLRKSEHHKQNEEEK
ncbi:hypothetical protein LSTR_LSTR000454 [Laodelphax striatellus]|uniref:CFA20 domain-containing protein n=1 Tax=Laodelphax striatellus TaxID=195883 RepID=A0A482X2I4_LAOST|nr:hypothetical protein LSTR_LSTR000454 [Laodelphax striatellus]